MKRLLVLLGILLVAVSSFSMALQEDTREAEIVVLGGGDTITEGGYSLLDAVKIRFRAMYPNVVLKFVKVDTSDGSARTMDAFNKSDDPVEIYWDWAGRVSKYLEPGFALDLSEYTDLSDYDETALIRRGDKVYGVAVPGSAQAMVVNLDLLEEIGYPEPDWNNWTINDFLDLCEAVKVATDGEKWGTGAFAGNMSGDYLMRNWSASFGANYFADGDYTKTAFNDNAALQTLIFFKKLYDEGYIPRDSISLVDDEYVIDWAVGRIAVTPFFLGWVDHYFGTVIEQGMIKEAFRYKFVPYPKAPGVEKVPVYGSFAALMAVDQGNRWKNQMLADLIDLINSPESQLIMMYVHGDYPNRKSLNKHPEWVNIQQIKAENGTYDVGMTIPQFMDTRPLFPKALQLLWGGSSPEEVLSYYQKEMNDVLE